MRAFWLFFLLFGGLATVVTANARKAVGTIEGTVIDAKGNKLSGATVAIQTSYGQHPHATRTDAKGHFQFTRFEVGQYDLRASFQGSYSDWAKRVIIGSNKLTQLTLQITPAKP